MMKKLVKVGLVSMISLGLLSGCGSTKDTKEETKDNSTTKTSQTTSSKANQPESTTKTEDDSASLFSVLSNREFIFSSGAGAWSTGLTLQADGTFSGSFHDSNMGEVGEGYSKGTIYSSDFTGKFINVTKVDDYTYKATLENLSYANEVGSEEIKDDIKYIYSDAYGLNESTNCEFYLPGKPVSELSDDYLSWTQGATTGSETINFYGIYAVDSGKGFMSE